MKSFGKVVSLVIAASVISSFSVGVYADQEVSLDVFTDPVLRERIADKDLDGNGSLSTEEIEMITYLDLDNSGVSSLQGIEYLTSLTVLFVCNTDIASLDISHNTELTDLTCAGNENLHELDLSHNTKIKEVRCYECSISTLILGNLPNMTELLCSSNDLSSLDVTGCPSLVMLVADGNHIDQIDISGCPGLNAAIERGTSATDETSIVYSICNYETTLNELAYDLSTNVITGVAAPPTEEETAVPTLPDIPVPSPDVVLSDTDILIDEAHFPDEIFRSYIFSSFDYDANGILSLEEREQVLSIIIMSKDVTSVQGIEYFPSLIDLTCNDNNISSIDLGNNPELSSLSCYNNENLTQLDLSANTKLEHINCSRCSLAALVLGNKPSLETLYCGENNLTSLDISGCPALTTLGVEDNDITVLDMQSNPGLYEALTRGELTDRGDYYMYYIGDENSTLNQLTIDHGVRTVSRPVSNDNPSGNSSGNSANAGEGGVAGFVERLYTIALGRPSDPVGKQDWVDAVTLRGETGAGCARGFLYSPEFLNKGVTNEEFVSTLYRTFFDREPDQAGFDAWVGALNNGTPKEEIIEGFINSTEWANLCLFYGIRNGGTGVPNVEVEPNEQTIAFATRLYTTCLGRDADQGGLMAWARQLSNQRDTGSGAARGFFFSSEFTGQNLSNGEFVTRLYRTFMDREPDQAGYDAWVGQLDGGASREEVFAGFTDSIEFARICAQYGIVR